MLYWFSWFSGNKYRRFITISMLGGGGGDRRSTTWQPREKTEHRETFLSWPRNDRKITGFQSPLNHTGHVGAITGSMKTLSGSPWVGHLHSLGNPWAGSSSADRGRQRKRWEDNIREWTGLEFAKSKGQWRTGKNGGNWLQNHRWCLKDPRGYRIDERWERDIRVLVGVKNRGSSFCWCNRGSSSCWCNKQLTLTIVSTLLPVNQTS